MKSLKEFLEQSPSLEEILGQARSWGIAEETLLNRAAEIGAEFYHCPSTECLLQEALAEAIKFGFGPAEAKEGK